MPARGRQGSRADYARPDCDCPAGGMIDSWRWRPRVMKPRQKRHTNKRAAKSVLRLPDLEAAKSAVLSSLSCPDAQRGYRHAIDEFVEWYCSEPRLSFSKTVVVRYRMHLETRGNRGEQPRRFTKRAF